jgi:hypothetical protein
MDKRKEREKLQSTCAWCGKRISKGAVYSVGAALRNDDGLADREGEFILIQTTARETPVPGFVTPSWSEAKADGFDIIFIACSRKCAAGIRDALRVDISLFSSLTDIN